MLCIRPIGIAYSIPKTLLYENPDETLAYVTPLNINAFYQASDDALMLLTLERINTFTTKTL